MSQIMRQLHILQGLQARRFGVSVRELVDEYEVNKRTIQRDLRTLQDIGFLLCEERYPGEPPIYRLRNESKIPVNFSPMEVAAMIFAERTGMGLVGTPFGEYLESVSSRLKDAMRPKTWEFLERATEAYVPHLRGHKSYETAREVFNKLHEAIQERRVCRVSYRSPWAESARQYNIEPLHLLTHWGGLYVISRMPYYDQLITQAVDRFESVEVTEEEFEPPDHLSVDERLSNAFGISSEEPMDVVVRFTEEQAPYIRDGIWHPSQRLEELDDGRVVLRLAGWGVYEIKSWVLSFGAAAEVWSRRNWRRRCGRRCGRRWDWMTRVRRDLSQGFINILREFGLSRGAKARQADFPGSILSTRFDFQLIAKFKINMSWLTQGMIVIIFVNAYIAVVCY